MSFSTSKADYLPIQAIPHLHCGAENKNSSKSVEDKFAEYIPNYSKLPVKNLQADDCITDGNLHMVPDDLNGNSVIKGKDGCGRVFVAYLTKSKIKKVECVNVIFQRYVDSTDIVSSCYTRGYYLGHDQLFSAHPDLSVAEETIKALLRGTHPYWKLQSK